MSLQSNDFESLWRSSANEGVPYSEDFPEPLLTLPEFIDGAVGAGKASIINIGIDITNPSACVLKVGDNGRGIVSVKRMKEWASPDIGDNKTENIYGFGSKKALSKLAPVYNDANWKLEWRTQDKRGVSSCLNTLHSPYKGQSTKHIEDEDNEDICPIHGTCWTVKFNLSVFGKKFNTPVEIMTALKELCRSRYEPTYYDHQFTINLKVINGATVLQSNSTEWKSLKESLEEGIASGNVEKTHDIIKTIDKTTATCSFYRLLGDGRTNNIPGMPTYGRKNMNSSRVHLARNGRYIEAMPYSKFMEKARHNDDNGIIGFVIFTGEELPTPCTTKVKFQEECPIFKKMIKVIAKCITTPQIKVVTVPPPVITAAAIISVPKPTISVSKPTISTSKPTISASKPTISVSNTPKTMALVKSIIPVKSLITTAQKTAPQGVTATTAPQLQTAPTATTAPQGLTATPGVTVVSNDDLFAIENLYHKYGSKLLINILNEINMRQ